MYPTNEQLEERWWHRLVRVIINLVTVFSFIFAIVFFVGVFLDEPPYFILSFESGYNEIKAKEHNLEDYLSSDLEVNPPYDSVLDRIKLINPPILSKNSFLVYGSEGKLESKRLYPEEFIMTQCKPKVEKGALPPLSRYSLDCLDKIVENYPDWKIKSWVPKDYSAFLVFLIVPITYFGTWFIYKKIILYIAFGKKPKTS